MQRQSLNTGSKPRISQPPPAQHKPRFASQEDFRLGQSPTAADTRRRRADLPAPRAAEPPPARVGPRGASEASVPPAASCRERAGPYLGRRSAERQRLFLPPSRMKAFLRRLPQRNSLFLLLLFLLLLFLSLPAPRPRGSFPHADADTKAAAPPPQEVPLLSLSSRIGLRGAARSRTPGRLLRRSLAAVSELCCNGG